MSKKNFNTIVRSIFILSIFLASFIFAGLAHATGLDSQTFDWNPATPNLTTGSVHTSVKTWPADFSTNGIYPRNVYWNFNVNPFVTLPCSSNCNPDATYYGSKDTALESSDTFTSTGNVAWTNSTTEKIGFTAGNNKGGTAVYTFNTATLKDASSMIYIWAEINVTTTGSASDDNITFSAPTGLQASEISNSSGVVLANSSSGLFNFNLSGTAATYYAWFEVKNPSSLEALTLNFNETNGHTGDVFVNSLHIAVTPEPMAMALFATGVAVLFFFRRRRMGLQVA